MNQLYAIEAQLPTANIKGKNLEISDQISVELSNWQNKTEHDPRVRENLNKYWDGYWWEGDPDVPWSAVFVSWILRDQEFLGSPQHLQYVKNIVDGSNNAWNVYSIPKNQGKIQLNIGDVLVRPRSGSDTATHGDIVYKMENGKAYLVGGNLGNTAKIAGTLKINNQGIVTEDIGNYLVILKKKSNSPILLIIPLAIMGTLVFFGLKKK
mgnify:CR=1 FL=1|tara:strand:- start:211 stop:837 length:627 start_codon:yes stop_codon:yes gene_type:complete